MKCSFCNKDIIAGTGKLYVTKEGKQFPFCSSKCEKNKLKLKRIARKQKWITKKHSSSSNQTASKED